MKPLFSERDLNPKRIKGEGYEEYRERRKNTKRRLKNYLKNGQLIWNSASLVTAIELDGMPQHLDGVPQYKDEDRLFKVLRQGTFKGNVRATFGIK